MNDHINGGNRPQVKRSSKLPVHISKTGGLRQPAKTSLKLSNHDGECSRDPQSANQDLSKNHIPENCVLLERSEDKENTERMTESGNLQHRPLDRRSLKTEASAACSNAGQSDPVREKSTATEFKELLQSLTQSNRNIIKELNEIIEECSNVS